MQLPNSIYFLADNTASDQEAAAAFSAFMGFFCVFFVIMALFMVIMLASQWIIYTKAGKPGWASIIPIYNVIVLAEIVGKEWWWGLLTMIPIVGPIIILYLNVRLASVFGKGVGYAIGIILLPFVFMPMLAFGKSKYLGPTAATI